SGPPRRPVRPPRGEEGRAGLAAGEDDAAASAVDAEEGRREVRQVREGGRRGDADGVRPGAGGVEQGDVEVRHGYGQGFELTPPAHKQTCQDQLWAGLQPGRSLVTHVVTDRMKAVTVRDESIGLWAPSVARALLPASVRYGNGATRDHMISHDRSLLGYNDDIPTKNLKAGTQKIRPWKKEKLKEFIADHEVDKISSFVIDEISTSGPDIVACVDRRLQQARGNDKVFGNIAVIFLGDYDQLPPVMGDSIPTTIVNLHQRSNDLDFLRRRRALTVATRGATLFRDTQHLKLTEQHRSVDPSHTRFIQDLATTGEISIDEMKQLYKPLAKEDEEFRHATTIVSGNYERHVINLEQSKRWAQSHKTHVLKWRRKLKEWKGIPSSVESIADATKQACFWETFVSGALGFVNFNLNTKIGIANGTGIRYHSVSFEKPEKNNALQRQIETTPAGGTIILDEPPDYINVEMFPDQEGDTEEERQKKKKLRQQWTYGSLENTGDKIVIPVSAKGSYIKFKREVVGGSAGYKPSSAVLQDHFPLELAFAMTVHKAQGRTIKKLILAISEHPLPQLATYEMGKCLHCTYSSQKGRRHQIVDF
ncbi:hypothetical protein THAOC_19240, partial [Thalassiosira oceanica]